MCCGRHPTTCSTAAGSGSSSAGSGATTIVDAPDYESLWQWSVTDLEGFWSAVWDFFDVPDHGRRTAALPERVMPGARWFPGARLNYVEQALRGDGVDADSVAVYARSQARPSLDLTWRGAARPGRPGPPGARRPRRRSRRPRCGVPAQHTRGPGGLPRRRRARGGLDQRAIEFGARSVIDRFEQVEPVVLVVAGGYRYGRKDIDRRDEVAAVRAALPTVRHVLDIEYGDWRVPDVGGLGGDRSTR